MGNYPSTPSTQIIRNPVTVIHRMVSQDTSKSLVTVHTIPSTTQPIVPPVAQPIVQPVAQPIVQPVAQPIIPPTVLQPTMVSQDQNGVRYSDGRYIPWMRELPCVNSYKQKAIDFNGTTIYSTKIPCASDCRLSEWTPWLPCDKPCGSGMTKRARAIISPALYGGKACDNLIEEKQCNTQECPIMIQPIQLPIMIQPIQPPIMIQPEQPPIVTSPIVIPETRPVCSGRVDNGICNPVFSFDEINTYENMSDLLRLSIKNELFIVANDAIKNIEIMLSIENIKLYITQKSALIKRNSAIIRPDRFYQYLAVNDINSFMFIMNRPLNDKVIILFNNLQKV